MKKYNNGEFRSKDIGKTYTVQGWVNKRRDMGGVIFVDLRDRSGFLQVVFNRGFLKSEFELAESLRNEYCIEVTGELSKRDEEMITEKIPTGEVELMVHELKILGASEPVPFNIYEDKEINETVSLKYRYLDLRRESLRQNIILRSKITKAVRDFLEEKDFLEIETPILCKSTPEGARDYIVPSRITPGSFYALPQSPQIFKQLLMISGFEKYFQIAKCFRDEDLRADRQPEFTQIDMEISFADSEDVMALTEELIKYVVKKTKNIELAEFPRITWQEAMDKYGSDKPDARFELYLNDLTDILKDTQMNVFRNAIEKGGIAKCLIVKNNADKYSRSDIEHMIDYAKIFGAKGMAWLKFDHNQFNGVIAKNLEDEKLDKMQEKFNITNNDLVLIVVDKPSIVYASLGALRLKIGEELNLIPKDQLNFLWVTDFPMFEYSEKEKRYKAMHHPFTMPKDIELIHNPLECLSDSYDIVLNGYELGGGSVRIHNPKDQKRVFEALGLTEEEIKDKFGFFIEAFKYGAPPHAGIAIGLERFTMLLSGTNNIKDVIAFPKTQSASDLMSEAPSKVAKEQLEELKIRLEDIDE